MSDKLKELMSDGWSYRFGGGCDCVDGSDIKELTNQVVAELRESGDLENGLIGLDDTLTEQGKAADAKAVGDAVGKAILFEAQTLTEEQKAQARENIGAAPMSLFKISDEESEEVLNRILTDESAFTAGKYCNPEHGRIIDASNYRCTEDYIEFPSNARLMVHYGGSTTKERYPIAIYYDENKVYISGEKINTLVQEDYNGKLCAFYNIPENTRFIRFSLADAYFNHYDSIFVYIVTDESKNGGVEIPDLIIPELNQLSEEIGDVVKFIPQTLTDEQKAQARENIGAAVVSGGYVNVFDPSENTVDKAINNTTILSSGALRTDTHDSDRAYFTTGKITVEPNVEYVMSKAFWSSGLADINRGRCYSATDAALEALTWEDIGDGDVKFITPLNSAYVRFAIRKNMMPSISDGSPFDEVIACFNNVFELKTYSESGGAEGAVLYTPQTLTDEQKAQARENIGALPMSLFKIIDGDSVDVLNRIMTDKSAFTTGKYLNPNNGNISDATTYGYTEEYTPFPVGARLLTHYSASSTKERYPHPIYYDENKVYIGGEFGNALTQEDYDGKLCVFYNVPEGTRFIRFTANMLTLSEFFQHLFVYIVTEEKENSGVEIPDLIVPELIDIRKGASGVTYENAGEAVRAQAKPLYGKTIVNFGDSIFGNSRPPQDISTMLEDITGATVKNCAFGGCRMAIHTGHWDAFSMYRLAYAVASNDYNLQDEALNYDDRTSYAEVPLATLKETDFSKVDIVTIAYGTNDWTGGNVLDNADNLYDTATVCGALRYSIETLLNAFPQIRVFVLLPTYRFWMDDEGAFTEDSGTKTNNHGKTLDEYSQAIRDVAESYNLPVIDNYRELGINKFNRTQYFPANDGSHHNENGRKVIAAHLAKCLW